MKFNCFSQENGVNMKKFLIFLVSIIIVVCIGSVTYAFLRNDEVITVKTKEIYCNVGDTISLNDLNISVRKKSRKTTYNYNAGGEDVTKQIEFDAEHNRYVVKSGAAGDVNLKITTSNKKFAEFIVSVHVGNGSVENPYYVFNESTLKQIESVYGLDKHYSLMSDIIITNNFAPIGSLNSSAFSGTFNGNNHKILNLKLSGDTYASAGLFSELSKTACVSNLTLDKANISGAYGFAGVLAGKVAGKIDRVAVVNSNIKSTSNNAKVGAVAGVISGNVKLTYVDSSQVSVASGDASSKIFAGGFAGECSGSLNAVYANKVDMIVEGNTDLAVCGGLVGNFIINVKSGEILQSYANAKSDYSNYGAFLGRISYADGFDLSSSKANFLRHLVGNVAIAKPNAVDRDVVKEFNTEVNGSEPGFFKNVQNPDKVFFDETAGQYLISYFASTEGLGENAFVFYSINGTDKTFWDFEYIWKLENDLPTLRFTVINPSTYTNEYLLKDVETKIIDGKDDFVSQFKENCDGSKFLLVSDVDLSDGTWKPVALNNCVIKGNGKTITINIKEATEGANNNLLAGLFSSINYSTIEKLNIKVKGLSATADRVGALAAELLSEDSDSSSSVSEVNVVEDSDTYSKVSEVNVIYDCDFPTNSYAIFGGLLAVAGNADIINCSVSGLNMTTSSNAKIVGGLIGTTTDETTVEKSTCVATVCGTSQVGGFIGVNGGSAIDLKISVTVNSKENAYNVGGVAGENNGSISSSNVTVNINSNISDNGDCYVGGVAGVNNKEIKDVTISGDLISSEAKNAFIGGVAGINAGTSTIENCRVYVKEIGKLVTSARQYVGGVTASNNSQITQCVVSSDLYGNIVGGVVANMNSSAKASIDQVMVAKYNQNSYSANIISGDKYVAGVVVDLQGGNISNVYTISSVQGVSESTRVSLVALVFTYGTSIKNVAVDSEIKGNGIKYREVWTDFASYSNKAEFGLGDWNGEAADGRFNVYLADPQHGSMQSVVINGEKEGVSGATASMGQAVGWEKDYNDQPESSYVKVISNFNDATQFQGSYEFVCAVSTLFKIEHTAIKTLTFDFESVWDSPKTGGITLRFLTK